jgi:peptidyl-dipeptidase Dcp
LASLSSKIYQTKIIQKVKPTTLPIKEVDQKKQQRLIWLNYTNFVKEGANLNPERKKVAKINGELASYFLRSVGIGRRKQ